MNFSKVDVWFAQQGYAVGLAHVQVSSVVIAVGAWYDLWSIVDADRFAGVFVVMSAGHNVTGVFF